MTTHRPATRSQPRPLPNIRDLPGYGVSRPGEVPVDFRLSSNESPLPPLPAVVDAIATAARTAHRYPPLHPVELLDRISRLHGVPRESILAGGGSIAVLEQLVRGFAGPGDEVLYGWRSYEAYPIIAGAAGATAVEVPLAGDSFDLDAILARVSGATRVVIVCNPNNPTGTLVPPAQLDDFAARLPARCLLILDEAYREFVADGASRDGLQLASRHANIAVLRTFSKAYGLAGLRAGYAIAAPEIIAIAERVALPFTLSGPALAGACAALEEMTEIRSRTEAVMRERDRLTANLRAAGMPVADSGANFLWCPLGAQSPDFAAVCAGLGVAVRLFGVEGVRVTVGTAAATDRVVEAAAKFLAGRPGGYLSAEG